MIAALDDAAALKRDKAVALPHGRQAMRDDNNGSPGRYCLEVGLDDLLALGIKRAGCFIEDQDAWAGYQSPRDGETLPLTTREVRAAFFDLRVITLRQLDDELVRASKLSRSYNLVERHGRIGERDVLTDRAIEQQVLLKHDADLPQIDSELFNDPKPNRSGRSVAQHQVFLAGAWSVFYWSAIAPHDQARRINLLGKT